MKTNILKLVIPYTVAALALAYLFYTLCLKGVNLGNIHFWVFLLVVFMVLASLAERLKLFNVIDFNSKMEALKKETKRELSEIRNQLSSNINSHVTPIQNQWTFVGVDEAVVGPLIQKIKESPDKTSIPTKDKVSNGDAPSYIELIRKVERCVWRAHDTLGIAFTMQIAFVEKRMVVPKDLVNGEVVDKVDYYLNNVLKFGLRPFVPNEEIINTTNQLMELKKVIDIYRLIKLEKDNLPDLQGWEGIVLSAHKGVNAVSVGIIVQSNQLIIASTRLHNCLTSMKEEIELGKQASDNKA
jgi:hypothetical protein